MNRLSLRRILSVAAAGVLGLVGAIVFASPASAHHTVLDYVAKCEDGQWKITWTVTESHPTHGKDVPTKMMFHDVTEYVNGSTTSLTGADLAFTNSNPTANVYPYNLPGPYTKVQTFPADTTSVALSLLGKWNNGYGETQLQSKTVNLASNSCGQNTPKATATYGSNCDGTVNVTLRNDQGPAVAHFTIDNLPAGTKDLAKGGQPIVVKVPANFGPITVREAGTPLGAAVSWAAPNDCTPVEITSRKNCTSLAIELSNPAGPTHHYVVKSGDKTVSGDIGPGETKSLDPFPATAGTTATVTIDNGTPTTVTWETTEVCYTPPPPDLPDTGNSLTPLLSIGGALLLGGAGMISLLFLLRRRRTTAAG